jgi:hypothetical protein
MDKVLVPILETGLSKAGICRKIAQQVVFAPNMAFGFGLHHPYVTQGIRKIEMWFNQTKYLINDLIETSWHQTMVESGFVADFLQQDHSQV